MSRAAANGTVAVRGTGSIGLRHLRVLRDLGIPAVAIPVRAGRSAELAAMSFQTLPSVGALGALAAHSRVRSIVATDTGRHLDDACEMLQYGDVLVEKPLAPSIAGLAEFASVAAVGDRKVTVGFCFRHHRGLQHFRNRLAAVGALHSVRIECQSHLSDWRPGRDYKASYSARRADGGVLRDLAHELDYAVWLFGRPEQVCCLLSNSGRLGIESEESADLTWRVASGAVVSVRLDYVTRPPRRRMTAYGEHGTLEWDHLEGTVVLTKSDGPPDTVRIRADHDGMIAAQAMEFLGLAAGTEPPSSCTLEEAAFIVALTDAAYASAGIGRWQAVKDWQCP